MPMDKTILAQAMAANVATLSEAEKQDLEAIWEKIAEAIILHIQTQAVVNGTTTVASGSSAGAWPTVGTIT